MNKSPEPNLSPKTKSSPHQNLLPDCTSKNLKILFVGINPGDHSARARHHYAGPNNHFWTCLYDSNLVDKKFTCNEDYLLPRKYHIGLTNICKRPTRTAAELSDEDFREGAIDLLKLIKKTNTKMVIFNGMGPYRKFLQYALQLPKSVYNDRVTYGRQPDFIEDVIIFAMPSSSPRAAMFPAARDKVPFYVAIREMMEKM